MAPVNTGQIQEKGRFPKGKSGNPSGKPKGARHRSSLLAEQLFAALCNTGRDGMDSAALGLLYEELSGIKR